MNWESAESHIFINPRYAKEDQERFQEILKASSSWPGHIWLSTSGSSVPKWVGLSKQALLISAGAVNRHLDSHKEDCWIQALPHFHVGGLGIWARVYLSGAKVADYKSKWRAEEFYHFIQEQKGTLSALVPTQLHDLVLLGKPAPANLRAIIIGGGTLLPHLYEQAVGLGWPILPSYGLTECASQVATAALGSWRSQQQPSLQLLPHFQGCEKEGRLCFAGEALLSAYAYFEGRQVQFVDPKMNGWFMTEDRGTIENGEVSVGGRADSIFKVGGENVDFTRLENHLQTLHLQLALPSEVTLVAMPDRRLGHCVHLASTSANQEDLSLLLQQFQQSVLPFERIRKVYFLKEFPRSSLGKILKPELAMLLYSAPSIGL